jgi:REP element-mobilizing transposase RayT
MSTKYKCNTTGGLYFVTMTVKHWIDVFTRRDYKDIIVSSLHYCQKEKGLEIFAWVIMSNHLHLIVRAKEGCSLPDILRDFKKFTSKQIVKAIEENPQESRKGWLIRGVKIKEGHQLWMVGSHPIELWNNAVIDEKLNYLHQNPVKSGYVFRAEDYIYSSAGDYAGEKGLIEICLLR